MGKNNIKEIINNDEEYSSVCCDYEKAHNAYKDKYDTVEDKIKFTKNEKLKLKKIIKNNERNIQIIIGIAIPLVILIITIEDAFLDAKKLNDISTYEFFAVMLLILMLLVGILISKYYKKINLCYICLEALEDAEKENNDDEIKKDKVDKILENTKQIKKFLGVWNMMSFLCFKIGGVYRNEL